MTKTTPESVPFKDRVYEIFNQRKTIGVAAGYAGAFRGLYLGRDVAKMKEHQLAQEILAVASVAAARGRLCLREEIVAAAAATDQHVGHSTFQLLPDVPTAEEYEAFKRSTLKY